jgi:uncharacterized protein
MSCPICKKATEANYQPFCSKRCADIDLGKWLTGSYAIPATDTDDEDSVSETEMAQNQKLH